MKPIKLLCQNVIQHPIPKQIDIDELEVSDQGDNDYVDEDNISIEKDESSNIGTDRAFFLRLCEAMCEAVRGCTYLLRLCDYYNTVS